MKFNQLIKGNQFTFANDPKIYVIIESSENAKAFEEKNNPTEILNVQNRPLHFTWNFDVTLVSK